jgi:hypothetical protein|tara:strand:+ start:4357 stop:4635 length:279 start_codon:yes stop_codon:yes gene_type:complete
MEIQMSNPTDTTTDPTEPIRRSMVHALNTNAGQRATLEETWGRVWTTSELTSEFDVIAFLAPYVKVVRHSDGQTGTLMFQHHPRYYFDFQSS